MKVDVILGLQWGDEGKGKIVDYLAPKYDIVARFQGGPNAGHTLEFEGKKVVLHTVPSGIFREDLINVIGNGVVIDPYTLTLELDEVISHGVDYLERLLVSRKAHLILPTHRYLDAASEATKGKGKIGSTLKGIGPTYMDKTGRNGLRVGDIMESDFKKRYMTLKKKHMGLISQLMPVEFDLVGEEKKWFEGIERLRKMRTIDGEYYLNEALDNGKKVLAEGAQGSMLDIDFGTYPYVTSSNTVCAGVCNGLGVAPQRIGEVIGISKVYCTRVGSGPFPTELHGNIGEKLRIAGGEFGATTGRPRRCGWIDIPQLKYTIMLNGVTQLVLTKLDVLDGFEELSMGVRYQYKNEETDQVPFDLSHEDLSPIFEKFMPWAHGSSTGKKYNSLPENAKKFIDFIELALNTRISMVSVGPGRKELVVR